MRRVVSILAAVGLLAMVLAPTTQATTTRIPYSCHTVQTAMVTDGRQWMVGSALYVRGWEAIYAATGSPICAGVTYVVVNYNLDLATMAGQMTFTYDEQLASGTGGIMGTAVTKFDFVDFIWQGSTVGHGYGSLEGWQSRGTITELLDDTVVETGFVFQPGS